MTYIVLKAPLNSNHQPTNQRVNCQCSSFIYALRCEGTSIDRHSTNDETICRLSKKTTKETH